MVVPDRACRQAGSYRDESEDEGAEFIIQLPLV